jgi:hypothetical protein
MNLYRKECLGILKQEECFPIYFPCDDFDCPHYDKCKEVGEQ